MFIWCSSVKEEKGRKSKAVSGTQPNLGPSVLQEGQILSGLYWRVKIRQQTSHRGKENDLSVLYIWAADGALDGRYA